MSCPADHTLASQSARMITTRAEAFWNRSRATRISSINAPLKAFRLAGWSSVIAPMESVSSQWINIPGLLFLLRPRNSPVLQHRRFARVTSRSLRRRCAMGKGRVVVTRFRMNEDRLAPAWFRTQTRPLADASRIADAMLRDEGRLAVRRVGHRLLAHHVVYL